MTTTKYESQYRYNESSAHVFVFAFRSPLLNSQLKTEQHSPLLFSRLKPHSLRLADINVTCKAPPVQNHTLPMKGHERYRVISRISPFAGSSGTRNFCSSPAALTTASAAIRPLRTPLSIVLGQSVRVQSPAR